MSIQKLENVNTIWSIGVALATIIQWILKIRWVIIVCTLAGLLALWVLWVTIVLIQRPWNKKMRPDIFRFRSGYPIRTVYNSIFRHPIYESNYVAPSYIEQVREDIHIDADLLRTRITVVVEDDPVGYILHRGSLPAFVVDEKVSESTLLHNLLTAKDEICKSGLFFIATPSRRLNRETSFSLNRCIGVCLNNFQHECGIPFRIISKIDSCMRSNYESEYYGLRDGFGPFTSSVLIPAYVEQGRITVNGHQYIKEDNNIIPIHKSEYASFTGLEYTHSNIALWLKSCVGSIISTHNIGLISVDELRSHTVSQLVDKIKQRPTKVNTLVFDCSEKYDAKTILKILLSVETPKSSVFYKFGPSMINAIAQEYVADYPVNQLSEIDPTDNAIVVAGSLSSATKRQLAALKDEPNNSLITLSNEEIDQTNHDSIINRKRNKVFEFIRRGDNVILTTEYWKTKTNEYPSIAQRDQVLSVLAAICRLSPSETEKSWIVLKGSDTALYTLQHGFGLYEFCYCGHIIPGVIHMKVKLSNGKLKSCFIIGGNVGDDNILIDLVNRIKSFKVDIQGE